MNRKSILNQLAKYANTLDSEGNHAKADYVTRGMVKLAGYGADQEALSRFLRMDGDEGRHKPHLDRIHEGRPNQSLDALLDPIGSERNKYRDSNGLDASTLDLDPENNSGVLNTDIDSNDLYNQDEDSNLGFDDGDNDPNADFDMDPYGVKGKDFLASNKNQIITAQKIALQKLAKYANKLDSEGKFAEADAITQKILRLAHGKCMECGHDGSKRPVSKYMLQDQKGSKRPETLCTTCKNKAKGSGYKVVQIMEQVAAPSSEQQLAGQQLKELNRMHRQERGDYWNPATPGSGTSSHLKPETGRDRYAPPTEQEQDMKREQNYLNFLETQYD